MQNEEPIEQNEIHKDNDSNIISFGDNISKKYLHFCSKNIYQIDLFINNNDYIQRFKCGLCENICNTPRYQYCGCESPYCKECLDFYYDVFHNRCPKCQKETKELIPNITFNESILNLNMKCKNYTLNCPWNGKFKDYEEHINKICPKEIINCPNKGCVIKLKREQMSGHLINCDFNVILCPNCGLKMPRIEKTIHKNYCPKEKIKCPRGCGTLIVRDVILKHEKECPYTDIDCPYKYILGCDDTFIIKDKNERLNKDISKHLNLAIIKIQNLSNEIELLKKEITNLNNNIELIKTENENMKIDNENIKKEYQNKMNEFIKTIKELTEKIKESDNTMNSTNTKNTNENIDIQKNVKEYYLNKNISNEINIKDKNNIEEENNNQIIISKSQKIENHSNILLSKKRKLVGYDKENNLTNSYNQEFSIFSNNVEEDKINDKEKDKNKEKEKDKSKENDTFLDYEDNIKIYNLLDNSKDLFTLKGDIIDTSKLKGDKHYYIFFEPKYDVPKVSTKKFSFKIKLLTKLDFLAVGYCDKKIVEKNNFEFDTKKYGKKKNLGIYIANVNRMVWNSNNSSQCYRLSHKHLYKKDTTIQCTLFPIDCNLEFMFNKDFYFKLDDVRCFLSDYFSPCLIFLKNGAVQTIFNYE